MPDFDSSLFAGYRSNLPATTETQGEAPVAGVTATARPSIPTQAPTSTSGPVRTLPSGGVDFSSLQDLLSGFSVASATVSPASSISLSEARDLFLQTPQGTVMKWPDGSVVRYYINPDAVFNRISEAELVNTVRMVEKRWEEAAGGAVDFQYAGITHDIHDTYLNPEMNVVYFDPLFESAAAFAITTLEYTPDGIITGFDMALNDRFYEFQAPGERNNWGCQTSLESHLMHEWGHTLGLKDLENPRQKNLAMYYTAEIDCGVPVISTTEKQALGHIYS